MRGGRAAEGGEGRAAAEALSGGGGLSVAGELGELGSGLGHETLAEDVHELVDLVREGSATKERKAKLAGARGEHGHRAQGKERVPERVEQKWLQGSHRSRRAYHCSW